MAATTMWDILLAGGGAPAPAVPDYTFDYIPDFSSSDFKPAATSTKTVAELEQEERDRKRAATEESSTPKSVEDRSKELLANMYGGYNGEFGGRVLTPSEMQFGYTNALGEYVAGQPTQAQLGLTEEEAARRRHKSLSQEWYTAGMDLFEGSRPYGNGDFADNVHSRGDGTIYDEAMAHVRNMYNVPLDQGVMTPWFNTFEKDRLSTLDFVRDSDYNAFLGQEGLKQSNANGYRNDSIAGWFKNAFSGADQVRNRLDAIQSLRYWNEDKLSGGYGLNKATDRMTKQYFDQLDLANKYGLTWEQAGAVANQNYSESSSPPVNPGNGAVLPGNGTALPGNGMLSRQNSNWMDVLNRGGAQNWDSLLGQYTYNSPLDWASMDNQTVQTEFSDLFDTGGMFTKGKNRDLIYAKLMENMGRV